MNNIVDDANVRCRKHAKPAAMFPCRVFDDIRVGYFCVYCFNFVPVDNPEIEVLRAVMKNTAEQSTIEDK